MDDSFAGNGLEAGAGPRYSLRKMARVVVFDMGGVLYDFQGPRLIASASRHRFRHEEVRDTWDPLVRSFETGACAEGEFAEAVVRTYDLTLDPAAFLVAFRATAVGFYDGALALVRDVGRRHVTWSLSNTNALQWPVVLGGLRDAAADPFHGHHPSHLSGFHKPDRRAFESLAATHAPDTEFYFFDDRVENVAAASALGWRVRQVAGVIETRRACLEFDLIQSHRG